MDGMTDIGKRIRRAREAKGWDQPRLAAEASKVVGETIHKQTIHKLESAENPTQNPARKALIGLAGALECTIDYILTGRIAEQPANYGEAVAVASGAIQPGYVRLELLDGEVGMGEGTANADYPEVLRHIDVAEAWARTRLPRDLSRIRILTARGDSNAPLINDGDILFVDIGVQSFVGEGLYLFNWMGHLLCKRLSPNLSTSKLEIKSENKSYETIEVSAGELDQLHIAGKLVAWWTLKTH